MDLDTEDNIQDVQRFPKYDYKYYLPNEISNVVQHFPKFELCSLHIHIHSLPAKIDSLKILLEHLRETNIEIHFILLCETFLKNENAGHYDIEGYNMVCRNREIRSRGGVAIYVKNHFNFTEIDCVALNWDAEFESIFIQVNLPNRKLLVGEVYRIPNSIDRYGKVIDTLTNSYPTHNITIGTYQNFDYMKINNNNNISLLFYAFCSAGIIPVIDKPTRITHSSATCIDNIYLKCCPYELSNAISGIIV